MSKRDLLLENTVEPEVFKDMDNFELANDCTRFSKCLRLQFPKFSKGFSLSDFEEFVREHVGGDNLDALGRLSFPNEWHMQVKSEDVREKLIRLGKTKIKNRTCWIWPLSTSEIRGYVHWLPNSVTNEKIKECLSSYGQLLFIENQKQHKWNGLFANDTRYYSLFLRAGKSKEDLPHFHKIDDYPCLITVRGRNPACFHCKEIGHRKSECKKFKEKLRSYSQRPALSAPKRSRPRGTRHTKPPLSFPGDLLESNSDFSLCDLKMQVSLSKGSIDLMDKDTVCTDKNEKDDTCASLDDKILNEVTPMSADDKKSEDVNAFSTEGKESEDVNVVSTEKESEDVNAVSNNGKETADVTSISSNDEQLANVTALSTNYKESGDAVSTRDEEMTVETADNNLTKEITPEQDDSNLTDKTVDTNDKALPDKTTCIYNKNTSEKNTKMRDSKPKSSTGESNLEQVKLKFTEMQNLVESLGKSLGSMVVSESPTPVPEGEKKKKKKKKNKKKVETKAE